MQTRILHRATALRGTSPTPKREGGREERSLVYLLLRLLLVKF